MKRLISVILLILFLPNTTSAHIIYLRNGETLHGEVIAETEDHFHFREKDKTYSIMYEYDKIPIEDVFAIIDEDYNIHFPRDLSALPDDLLIPQDISEEDYQLYLDKQYLKELKRSNETVSDIRDIMFTMLLITVTGITIGLISSQ